MTSFLPLRRAHRKKTALIVAVVFGFLVFAAISVTTSTPSSCASCHTMQPFVKSLAKSPHSQVHCYSCHVEGASWGVPQQKIREWGPMLKASVSGQGLRGPARPISSARCLTCHEKVLDGPVTANGTRINHRECVQAPAQCTDCHNGVAHGAAVRWPTGPVMEECILCHRKQGAPVACDSCHKGKGTRDRLAVGPWQITHGVRWRSTHGQANLRYCVTCHPQDYCVRCHGTALPHGSGFGRTHGTEAKKPNAKCISCHRPALCDSCHGIPMPHPNGFLKRHSTEAKSVGKKPCLRCHDVRDCDACHTAHVHPGRTDGTLGKGTDGVISLPQPKGGR